MASREQRMQSDKNLRTDVARAARTRADDARKRAVAARERAELATTEYARRAEQRAAEMHDELALSHEDHARSLRRASDREEA